MGAPWITALQNLEFAAHEKGMMTRKLYEKCEYRPERIQSFFDDCLAVGGEEALTAALRSLLPTGQEVHVQKKVRVQVFSTQADGEELVLRGRWLHLTPSTFKSFILTKGPLVPFKEGQPVPDVAGICEFGELIEGESYFLEDFGGVYGRVKQLENFNLREMKACEDELAHSMMVQLKAHGIAKHPILRPDLRLHCAGTSDEQEFDAVLLDEGDKAFIGSAKHAACGTAEVQHVIDQVETLLQRSRDVERYPSYAPFCGRALGCCLRVDHMDQGKQHAIEHLCFRKGVGLFQRSGASLALWMLSFTDQQAVNSGFINMVVRGIKMLAR